MKRWLTALLVLAPIGAVTVWAVFWGHSRIEYADPSRTVALPNRRDGDQRRIDDRCRGLGVERRSIRAEASWVVDVEWVIADGQSDWPTFAREAQRLIDVEKVSVIFGCWTSASRKSVKPVVEERSHLLIYPMAYEGLEQSQNIVYTGAAPNQQVIPAVSWCYESLKARRFFLVGSDYVWPHCVNEIVKDQLKALGAECAGESYIAFGSVDVSDAVGGHH